MMSVFSMLAACGGSVLKSQTFTSSQSWVVPAGVTSLNTASGYGARGKDGGTRYVRAYTGGWSKLTKYRDGRPDLSEFGSIALTSGVVPDDYCTTQNYSSGAIASITTCYSYTDQSYYDDYSPTTGASATMTGTGVSRTFPGSRGDVQPSTTTFQNVAVTSGQSLSMSIPTGGRITVTYYE